MQYHSNSTVKTTLGDLISALADVALSAAKSETEGYRLASIALERILREKNSAEVSMATRNALDACVA